MLLLRCVLVRICWVSGMVFFAHLFIPCPAVFEWLIWRLIWLKVHSFDSSDAAVVFHASSSSFHSCSSSSHWAPSYVICLILWLGSSPPASHQVVADSMECPLASSQSLCHVRIKSGLEVVNHQHSSQTLFAGFLGLSHSFTSGFVIADSMYLLLPCSLNPERRKARHWCWSQHCSLPPFLPSLPISQGPDTWLFLLISHHLFSLFWLQIRPKDRPALIHYMQQAGI